jgi:hypothetical protein
MITLQMVPKNPKPWKILSSFSFLGEFMTISVVGFLAYLPSWVLIVIETNNPSFWDQLSIEAFQVCLTLRRMYMINIWQNYKAIWDKNYITIVLIDVNYYLVLSCACSGRHTTSYRTVFLNNV